MIDSEETLEHQIIQLQKERNSLIDTIQNLTRENNELKGQSNCVENYSCSTNEKCNITSAECESVVNDSDIDDDDEGVTEFITPDGAKYIGSKSQIEKLKKRLTTQQQIVTLSRDLSEPNELNDRDDTHIVSERLSNIQIREQQELKNRINSILSMS